MLRKAAWLAAAPVLLAIVILNASLAVNCLRQVRDDAARARETSVTQAILSVIVQDLTDMETGQRGYLLTADSAYLQPYSEAKAKIADDFAALRSALANAGGQERTMEAQLESVAGSKEAEMERTISLRERGFRLRAFKVVDTDEGKDYMDRARTAVSAMLSTQKRSLLALDTQTNASLHRAFLVTIVGNLSLLAIGALLFAILRYDRKRLLRQAASMKEMLAVRESQLEKLTFALSNQTHSNLNSIEANAELLLQKYGGFLPREGYAHAEQIKEAAVQMEQLRKELLWQPASAA
jgi:CHASE3 domain sensor protein